VGYVDRSFSWLGTGTSIKSSGVKLETNANYIAISAFVEYKKSLKSQGVIYYEGWVMLANC
jgi:hypothetical protein